ncbi:hypothetical protein [Nonomuraea sp. NPDC049158]|uniref:hypothetical protein n=1 Tax=Nonomuraea sp. NPDC049158 TaxID=3155649 RepID=UPI0033E3466C
MSLESTQLPGRGVPTCTAVVAKYGVLTLGRQGLSTPHVRGDGLSQPRPDQ